MRSESKTRCLYLHQYGPNKYFPQLPTFDPSCLSLQAYLKFSDVDFLTINERNFYSSPSNKLPFMVLEDGTRVTPSKRFEELAQIVDLDSQHQSSLYMKDDLLIWTTLCLNTLHYLHAFNWFGIDENYYRVIAPAITQSYYFPLSSWLTNRIRQNYFKTFELLSITRDNYSQEANQIYAALSRKLGDKLYLYGDRPTSLDAIVFGYLASQTFPDLPNKKLSSLIQFYGNLVKYVERIANTYFQAKFVSMDEQSLQNWLHPHQPEKDEIRSNSTFPTPSKSSGIFQLDSLNARYTIGLGIAALVFFCTSQNIQFSLLSSHLFFSPKKALLPIKSLPKTEPLKNSMLGHTKSHSKNEEHSTDYISEPEESAYHRENYPGDTEYEEDPEYPENEGGADSKFLERESSTSTAIMKTLSSPYDQTPLGNFENEKDTFVEDDNDIYDWDEQYLDEIKNGAFPVDENEFDSDNVDYD